MPLPALLTLALLPWMTETPAPKVAQFAGGFVTVRSVEQRGAAALYNARRELYELQIRIAEDLAFDQLVEAEARMKGLAPRALVEMECARRAKTPTAADVQKLLPEIRKRQPLPEDPAAAAKAVEEYAREHANLQAFESYRGELLQSSGFRVDLEPPRLEVSIRPENPAEGATDAPITLVVFSDFQCEHCRKLHDSLTALATRYPGKVRFVYKQTPLEVHAEARPAARAYLRALKSGAKAEVRDRLYKAGGKLSDAALRGLDGSADATLDGIIAQDLEEAAALGITGAPSITVNGRLMHGAVPLDILARMVEDELRWREARRAR